MVTKETKSTADSHNKEHEDDADAKRIVTVDSSGTPISSPGLSKSYEDTSFVTGDSPVVLDVNNDLARNGTDGYLINDGPGNFTVAFSDDGTDFGEEHTIKHRERINLKNLNIDKIRITHILDSSYRILVI